MPTINRRIGSMTERPRDMSEVLFEFYHMGRTVKVSAIDPLTGTEVSIVGDPRHGEEALKRIAVRKLRYVLEKRSKG